MKSTSVGKTWRELFKSDHPDDLKAELEMAYSEAIPDDIRSDAWFIRSGARNLFLKNSNIYHYLCTESRPNKKVVVQIDKDIPRTFRSPLFVEQFGDALRRILSAYSLFNPSVQYTQGMNYIAAFILRQFFKFPPSIAAPTESAAIDSDRMIEEQCFWTFTAVLSDLDTLFMADLVGFHLAAEALSKILSYHGPPDLVRHLEAEDVTATVLTSWYHTLFAHPAMDGVIARRIWDIFILQRMDFAIVLKISYLILLRHKEALLRMDFVQIAQFCKSPAVLEFGGGDDHDLIERARKLQLNELYLKPVRRLKYVKDTKHCDIAAADEEEEVGGRTMWSFLKKLLPFT